MGDLDPNIFSLIRPLPSFQATLGEMAAYKERQQNLQIQQGQLAEQQRKLAKENADQASQDEYDRQVRAAGPLGGRAPASPPIGGNAGMPGLPGGATPDGTAAPAAGTPTGTGPGGDPLRESLRMNPLTTHLLPQYDAQQQKAADQAAVTTKNIQEAKKFNEEAAVARGKVMDSVDDYVGNEMVPIIRASGFDPVVTKAVIGRYATHFKDVQGTDQQVSQWSQQIAQGGSGAIHALVDQYQAAHDQRHSPSETDLARRATDPTFAPGAPAGPPPNAGPPAGGPPPAAPGAGAPTPNAAPPGAPPNAGPPPGPGPSAPPSAPTASPVAGDPRAAAAFALQHPGAPGQIADSDAKVRANAAGILGGTRTQAEYTAAYRTLPPALASQFPDPQRWTPMTARQVRQLGMTPEQQTVTGQTAANQAAELGLRGASEAETRRHNLQTEQSGNPFGALTAPGAGAGAPTGPGPQGASPGPRSQPAAPVTPGLPSASVMGPDGPHGDAFLALIAPNLRGDIKAYAEGRRAWPTGISLSKMQPLLQAVTQYDPTFDATVPNARNKARSDLTSPNGAGGKAIGSLNTAVSHLQELSAAADALHNGNVQLYNKLTNGLATSFGWTGKTDFDTIAPKVADEVERLWRGSGGSEGSIERTLGSLNTDMSTGQIQHAIGKTADLIQGKFDSLEFQRDQALGKSGADIQIVSPKTSPILQRLRAAGGVAPAASSAASGSVKMRAPDGSVAYVTADQVAAAKAKGAQVVP